MPYVPNNKNNGSTGPVDASEVTFTPIDNSDWNLGDPGNVDNALDELADFKSTTQLHIDNTSNPHSLFVNDLLDANVESPNDGQVLTFIGGSLNEWQAVNILTGVIDHGLLTGLSDDDHDQYIYKTPATGRNTISPTGASYAAITLQEFSTTTTAILSVKEFSTLNDVIQLRTDGSIRLGTDASGAAYHNIISAGTTTGRNATIPDVTGNFVLDQGSSTIAGVKTFAINTFQFDGTISTNGFRLANNRTSGGYSAATIPTLSGSVIFAVTQDASVTANEIAFSKNTTRGDITFRVLESSDLPSISLDDLYDVDTATPDDGYVLTFVGGSVNAWQALPTITGVTAHSALTGLGADDHTQYLLSDGTRSLSANWDAGSFEIRSQTFQSDQTTGTAPFTVTSTTLVTNLNADLLDGLQASAFATTSLNNLVSVAINTSLLSDTDITDNLGSSTKRWDVLYSASINTGTTAGNTVLFRAWDTDVFSYQTFATLMANNPPTFNLASSVTIGGNAIAFSAGAFHDGFSDFVSNEHIDHTSVTITAGTGLTGGGTIAATRTLNVAVTANQGLIVSTDAVDLDLSNLVTKTSIDDGDFVPFWDITAATNKKIIFSDFKTYISSALDDLLDVSASNPSDDDILQYVGGSVNEWQSVSLNHGGIARIYAETITGNASDTVFTVTHNFSTQDVQVSVWNSSNEEVTTQNAAPTNNTVTITFSVAPANALEYRVVVVG